MLLSRSASGVCPLHCGRSDTKLQLPASGRSPGICSQQSQQAARRSTQVSCEATDDQAQQSTTRRSVLGTSLALALAANSQLQSRPAFAKVVDKEWEKVKLPVDPGVVLLDIAFTDSNPDHGFLLGSRQTLLETNDGGKTWNPRQVAAAQDEGFNYRFQSISFAGEEGWIVGKPAILLHTKDGGKNWDRVPLSGKLPGNPVLVVATGSSKAEMTTDQGAIYVTDNGAYSWAAAVQETVDATLNRTVSSGISGASYYEGSFSQINRSPDGDYVAVSSRGNFYLTWQPGQTFWTPHNRPTARRVQNMGWTQDNFLWLASRGGDVFFGQEKGGTEKFEQAKLGSRGFGILDVSFRDGSLGYACGGSGSLFKTSDGGDSWKRVRATDDVAGNLYAIKWQKNGAGYILGNDGILLRYIA
ncbi:hypothetical protein WJX84_009581 [Apatococcus fuscideae]|uniref:Photosynthesis system II assembly factor Ycf48/Hcf136-like domain-containing protein n=1 Tax=Apatococcus fuscideae TaxID=2026836 RepID=A0AAW1SU46_9CHLO